jgi:hypothetical protein
MWEAEISLQQTAERELKKTLNENYMKSIGVPMGSEGFRLGVFSQSCTFRCKANQSRKPFSFPPGFPTLKSKPFKYLCSTPESSRVILVPGFRCSLHVREFSALSLLTLCINWRSAPVVTAQTAVAESFDVCTYCVLSHAVTLGPRGGAVG